MWAMVPLKSFDQAKKRLASVLTVEERRALMLAMARDVLSALSRSQRLTGILIVSRAPEADALAQTFGTERFSESPDADLSLALVQAGDYLKNQLHAAGTMIVPADVPLIEPTEVDAVLAQHEAVTVVPDNDNIGTNCLICSRPTEFPTYLTARALSPILLRLPTPALFRKLHHPAVLRWISIPPAICRFCWRARKPARRGYTWKNPV